MQPATEEIAAFVAGFVVAEGTFTSTGATATVFRFAIGLGSSDSSTCDELLRFFGVGHVNVSPRRKPHYQDEVTFSVQAQRELIDVVVPFMDEHLPQSYKRQQYLVWRTKLLDYRANGARRQGRRPCTAEGCDEPSRAHGYCRHHLWEYLRK